MAMLAAPMSTALHARGGAGYIHVRSQRRPRGRSSMGGLRWHAHVSPNGSWMDGCRRQPLLQRLDCGPSAGP
eukprot:2417338-Pyramimonas_sp.AAC.1